MDILAVVSVLVLIASVYVSRFVQDAFLRHKVRKLVERFDYMQANVNEISSEIETGNEPDILEELSSSSISAPNLPNDKDARPPQKLQLILRYTLRASDQEVILGDMHQRFREHCEEHGYKSARRWYRWETIRTVSSQIIPKLTRFGIVAYLVDLVRKIIA